MDDALLKTTVARFEDRLGDNDQRFLERIFGASAGAYADRLRAIGFAGCSHVLDAGCGFGQWTLALAELNEHVSAIDVGAVRVEVLAALADGSGLENIAARQGRLEELPYADATFDAAFCYGVIFCTAWRQSLSELARVLAPGGRLYVTANGLGWYLNLWKNRPNAAADYDPREVAALSLMNTVAYDCSGQAPERGQILIPPDELAAAMADAGLAVVARGAEGTLHVDPQAPAPTPFFQGEYFGETGVYEVLATRRT